MGFYDCTPIEFHYALLEASRKEQNEYRLAYEVARYSATHTWNAQGRSLKATVQDPKDLHLFSWEERKVVIQTAEEMERMLMAMVDSFNQTKTETDGT